MADWRRKYEELRDAVRALLRQQDLAGSPAADWVEELVRRRVFVACGTEDEGVTGLMPVENRAVPFLVKDSPVEFYSVCAESWEDAMQIYYDNQGWGKYIPNRDLPKD